MLVYGKQVHGEIDRIYAHSGKTALSLPLFGSPVYAGFASLTEDWIEEYIDFNHDVVRNPDTTFYARIKNDSMEPVLQDGSIVVYDSSLEYTHGSLVVAVLNGGYIAKRYWRVPGGVELRSHNSKYRPIVITEETECEIRGKIIAVIQMF